MERSMRADTAHEAPGATWIGGSALRGPLLGLLLQQEHPIAAYRLSSLLMQRLPAWHVAHSAVANLLKRLVVEGYVSFSAGPTRGYIPTSKARLALEEWMQRPLCRQAVREELHARIASSSPHHAPLLYKALDAYERECFEILEAGGGAGAGTPPVGSWRSLTINLTHAAADETLHANIRWSKLARQWIRDWVVTSRAGGPTL
jgi:DNA-binding PadR family transcriptional regulator